MIPVFYHIPKQSTPKRPVYDLSIGGVRVYSDERLDVGQTLELEFVLPDGRTLEAAARIVWIKKQPPGAAGVYDVGMEFMDLPEPVLKELAAVLKMTNPPGPV